MTDLHLFVLRHQAALQFLRVSKLFQQVQGQLLVQALLGQKHVLHRGREETQEAKDGERERERDNQSRLVRSKIKRETGRDVVTVSLRFHNTRRLNVVLILQ